MQLSTLGQNISESPGLGNPLSAQKAKAESILRGNEKFNPKSAFKTRGLTTGVATATEIAGGITVVVGVAMSVDHVVTADNKALAASQEIGGWTGAYAGAAGAEAGAGIGVWFGGVGAIPGAAIGGLVGGVVGYISGYNAGGAVYNIAH
jgi:hypothetical protein